MKVIDTYHKWVEWSDEDQVYIGKCPELFQSNGESLPSSRVRPMNEVA